MSLPHLFSDALGQLHMLPGQDPPPTPLPTPDTKNPPPGYESILIIVGYVKWIAGASIVGLFFGGIVAATAGRLWDHHGSGRLGARLIVGSLALALLFGIGWTVINQFATPPVKPS